MNSKIFHCLILALMLGSCAPARNSLANSQLKTDAIGRHIVGPAVNVDTPYHSPLEKKTITASLLTTRALAWQRFAAVVASTDVTLAAPPALAPPPLTSPSPARVVPLPTFATWYSPEDFDRLMSFSFNQLTPDDNEIGKPLTEAQWATSQGLLDDELLTLPLPLQKKWERFFEDVAPITAARVIGATGLNRTLFSPDLMAAVATQYADLQDCFKDDRKPSAVEPFHPCWNQSLPASSIAIKTTWLNTEAGFYSVDTDAEALARLFHKENASWSDGAIPTPLPDTILKAEVAGRTFVLGGIHIISKELDDWLWISAWWSADPDHDFGEDRPDAVQKLGPPWNHYKLCAVSAYTQDPAELGKIAITHPTLARAYRAVLDETGASWCSNPYIEKGVHNHQTNCIGCHQFAGTEVLQEDVISDGSRFPALGRLQQRSDFPSDYIWSATQGRVSWLNTLNNLRFRTESP